jgi:glycosyltransferase involved in cell wall biosynthesis
MYEVTVGIACYKQKKWLHRCLRSLAAQTMDKRLFEVIIVNDDPESCLDDVIDVFKPFLNIKLLNNDNNIGLPASLNRILKQAIGRYFVRVDSDDYISRHMLTTLTTFLYLNSGPRIMDTRSNFQAVKCDYFKVNDTGELLSRHDSRDEPMACGVMFNYEALINVGLYNEQFKMREGHELMIRFEKKYSVGHLNMPLYKYRMHDSNRTNDIKQVKQYDKKLGEIK